MFNLAKNLKFIIVIFIIISTSVYSITFFNQNNNGSINNYYKNPEVVENVTDTLLDMMLRVNESILEEHLKKIERFGPHPTGSDAVDKVGNYIYNCLDNLDLEIKYQNWRYKFKKGKNIEATQKGIGSTEGIIILCAHYDSTTISPGVDDDGSGVASILTIAKILNKLKVNTTIRYVLFTGEEQGLLGSHEYVEKASKNKDKILGVVCLDSVGYAKTKKEGNTIRNFGDENSNWIYDISKNLTEKYKKYIKLDIEKYPHKGISDHQSFYKKGFATSYFFEYTLDPYYHTSEDTLDKMNMSYLVKVCRLTLGTIFGMSNLNRMIYNEDIEIKLKGSILSYPEQLTIKIKNNKCTISNINLLIHIEINNLFSGNVLSGPYGSFSKWNYTKDIKDNWEFVLGSHSFSKFELIRINVIIKGLGDETGLYKKKTTVGFVRKGLICIIPKF